MRIIAEKTLVLMSKNYLGSESQIQAWVAEIKTDDFSSPNQPKEKYKNASIINNKRVVFNIKGNDYRLVVDIEYRQRLVFIVWFGTHKEYDKIDVEGISFQK